MKKQLEIEKQQKSLIQAQVDNQQQLLETLQLQVIESAEARKKQSEEIVEVRQESTEIQALLYKVLASKLQKQKKAKK